MAMNPAMLFKIKGAWEKFVQNHPKFPLLLRAASTSGIREGYIIEVKITDTDGKAICTNVKLTESDMELIGMIKDMSSGTR